MALLGNTGILFLFFYGKEKGRIKDFLGRTNKLLATPNKQLSLLA
jgi:hypothetical protein